jgi:hypothetical protein
MTQCQRVNGDRWTDALPVFLKEGYGGVCSVIHADHYFVLRIEDSQTLCNIRSWRNVNLLYEVKIYRRKPLRFVQQEKAKKASCCRRLVCIPRGQTARHFDVWIVFLHHRNDLYNKKKGGGFKNKPEWTVVNLLALFALLKSVEIWTLKNTDMWWTVLSIQVWISNQCLLVFYTRDRNAN